MTTTPVRCRGGRVRFPLINKGGNLTLPHLTPPYANLTLRSSLVDLTRPYANLTETPYADLTQNLTPVLRMNLCRKCRNSAKPYANLTLTLRCLPAWPPSSQQNICFVEEFGRNPGLPNTAGTLGLGAKSHCNVELTKKGRQTARTFVAAGIADPTPGCAGAKKIPFYGSADLLRAERRAGEMLSQMEKHPGGLSQDVITPPQTLTELGVTPMQSHRWQTEASLPEQDLIGQVTANPKHIHHNNPDGNNVTIRGNASTYSSADPTGNMMKPVESPRDASADFVDFGNLAGNHKLASADFGYSDDNPEAAIIVKGGMSDDNPKAGIVGRTTTALPDIMDNDPSILAKGGQVVHNSEGFVQSTTTSFECSRKGPRCTRAGGKRCLTQQN